MNREKRINTICNNMFYSHKLQFEKNLALFEARDPNNYLICNISIEVTTELEKNKFLMLIQELIFFFDFTYNVEFYDEKSLIQFLERVKYISWGL
jgi:hypothetical protein